MQPAIDYFNVELTKEPLLVISMLKSKLAVLHLVVYFNVEISIRSWFARTRCRCSLRPHQNYCNTDDCNSNKLEELRRNHKTYRKQLEELLEELSKSIVATFCHSVGGF